MIRKEGLNPKRIKDALVWQGECKRRRCSCACWDERLGENDQRRRLVFPFIWLGHDTPTTDIARYCCCAQLLGGAGKILDEAQVVGGTECQSATRWSPILRGEWANDSDSD